MLNLLIAFTNNMLYVCSHQNDNDTQWRLNYEKSKMRFNNHDHNFSDAIEGASVINLPFYIQKIYVVFTSLHI